MVCLLTVSYRDLLVRIVVVTNTPKPIVMAYIWYSAIYLSVWKTDFQRLRDFILFFKCSYRKYTLIWIFVFIYLFWYSTFFRYLNNFSLSWYEYVNIFLSRMNKDILKVPWMKTENFSQFKLFPSIWKIL